MKTIFAFLLTISLTLSSLFSVCAEDLPRYDVGEERLYLPIVNVDDTSKFDVTLKIKQLSPQIVLDLETASQTTEDSDIKSFYSSETGKLFIPSFDLSGENWFAELSLDQSSLPNFSFLLETAAPFPKLEVLPIEDSDRTPFIVSVDNIVIFPKYDASGRIEEVWAEDVDGKSSRIKFNSEGFITEISTESHILSFIEYLDDQITISAFSMDSGTSVTVTVPFNDSDFEFIRNAYLESSIAEEPISLARSRRISSWPVVYTKQHIVFYENGIAYRSVVDLFFGVHSYQNQWVDLERIGLNLPKDPDLYKRLIKGEHIDYWVSQTCRAPYYIEGCQTIVGVIRPAEIVLELLDEDNDGFIAKEDCNDLNSGINPSAAEVCGDWIDQDCNGSDEICPADPDLDNDGFSENQGDCNDAVASINPGATEVCGDGIDQNCSGEDPNCIDSYTDNGNGTVTDNATGLIWQQSDDDQRRDWQSSVDYCNNLILGGSSSWRLPNYFELMSLIDYPFEVNASINPVFIGINTSAENSEYYSYWTSEPSIDVPSYGFGIFFPGGWNHYTSKADSNYVRCVR